MRRYGLRIFRGFPRPLKTDKKNERQVPIRQTFVDAGFLDIFDTNKQGYMFSSVNQRAWPEFFKY